VSRHAFRFRARTTTAACQRDPRRASLTSEAIKHRELEEQGIVREVTGWMSHYCDLHLQPTCGAG
jgi:hypothetical protein